jgi:soluble lytic murein transglycosylase-like protein
MKITITIAGSALLLVTMQAVAGEKFSAADAPGVGLRHKGKVLIQNDHRSITAFQLVGEIRSALFSLRSSQSLSYAPFGTAVFNSRAPLRTRLTPELAALIQDAASSAGVDPRLIVAVAGRESRYDAKAVSPVGACGIMQLMPATARYLGVTNVFDPRENVFAGARYLRTLLDTFHGDLDLTLAAYNAGPGAVARHNGIPPYRETQAYVAAVRASYEQALRE